MIYLYSIIISLLLPFAVIRLFIKSSKNKAYRKNIKQRFALGLPKTNNSDLIWLHCVSVGEFLASLLLIQKIIKQFPNKQLLITTTTPTGMEQITKKLSLEINSEKVIFCYLPFDAPFLVSKFLNHFKPEISLFMETEIWANYINKLYKRNIPTFLINARLSEKSFNSYQKANKFNNFANNIISKFTKVICQNQESASRFEKLNAKTDIITNIKFDIIKPNDLKEKNQQLKQLINKEFILAASTHTGEDEIIIKAYKQLVKENIINKLLVIVPRHPERADNIIQICKQNDLISIKKSNLKQSDNNVEVIIIDSIGELIYLYSMAYFSIIGGSFIEHGGHNPLESALFKTPCIIGNSSFNFPEIINQMLEENAIIQCEENNSKTLKKAILELIENKQQISENSYKYLQSKQGSTDSYIKLLKEYLITN